MSGQFTDHAGLERATAQETLALANYYIGLATKALGLNETLVRKMSAVMRQVQSRFPDTKFAFKPGSDFDGRLYLVIDPGEKREAKALVGWTEKCLDDFFSLELALPEDEV